METLGELRTFQMNKKLILALDERWLSYFDSSNPTFKVVIDHEKYVLVGPKVNRSGPTSNHTSNEADIL